MTKANLTIDSKTVKFLSQKITVYRLCAGNEVIRAFQTREEAEAVKAAMEAA